MMIAALRIFNKPHFISHAPSSSFSTAFTAAAPAAAQSSQHYIDKEYKYGAHNYKPIPVVIARGSGQLYR
jgi:hypothetical protein